MAIQPHTKNDHNRPDSEPNHATDKFARLRPWPDGAKYQVPETLAQDLKDDLNKEPSD